MEKEYKINLSEDDIRKIAKLNKIKVEEIDSGDITWTLKLLLSKQK